ncbi:ATPase [Candidatus Thiomargarita nelsonii]|uniref:ATPase n=1 Tax=Candidatus Thiomargarita nelsonii TaxID=1003181 RepID=A0A0A6PLV3_9GAMM|nr:ATPase [Candidatus Thiomargarita nelsonii]
MQQFESNIYNSKIEPPRIEYLCVENYRALKFLELKNLTAFTVFLGPNGSGKSTLFDVFAFLSECFSLGLRRAWEQRGRFRELRTRGGIGPLKFVLKYRENPNSPLITYYLAINETTRGPIVEEEWLQWQLNSKGKPFRFLDFRLGEGFVLPGEFPGITDTRMTEKLESAEMLAVNTLGQFSKHPRISALRRFISDWHLSYLTAENTRGIPEAGPQEYLSQSGNNLPNVIQYFREQYPQRLDNIIDRLCRRIPRMERVEIELLTDGRLLLRLKDAPFEQPVLAKYASDGTLKMLAYLMLLYNPEPLQFIGIEEPENHLHPRLLPELCEECRNATAQTQLMVTTHSPFFVNGLRPEELWVLYRDELGFTRARRASDMLGIKEFMAAGALLGQLWIEGYFEVGDPMTNNGGPR